MSTTRSQHSPGRPRPRAHNYDELSGTPQVASTSAPYDPDARVFDAIQPARRVRHPVLQGSHVYASDLLCLTLTRRPGYRLRTRLGAAYSHRPIMVQTIRHDGDVDRGRRGRRDLYPLGGGDETRSPGGETCPAKAVSLHPA
eukprot:5723508-Pyramimonas_sp.AAC.1